MKKIILPFLFVLFLFPSNLYAEWVNGYFKSNGTYVEGYFRSDRNNTVTDNYSYYGNTNPYTGSVGTNKYYDNPTSEYYDPYYDSGSGYGSSLLSLPSLPSLPSLYD
tara:strand:+ start:163 stop:483 length:321 start_codon:yes stop_codon:yes gene_type:complete